MISEAENELLPRVGRKTPMGKFMRQFWIPACLSSELQADGPQMRLMLLGEKLIAFRDTAGRVGIFDHLCPHRRASLRLSRMEIRCRRQLPRSAQSAGQEQISRGREGQGLQDDGARRLSLRL